jgi:hypothetical protein
MLKKKSMLKNLQLNYLSFLHNTIFHVIFKVTEPATPLLGSGPGRGIFFYTPPKNTLFKTRVVYYEF